MAVDWVAFHLTDRCQLDCQHCLRDPQQKPKDLDIEILRKALVSGRQVYNASHAVFTGGEPLLHPRFDECVDVAVDLGYTWHAVTNGKRAATLFESLSARKERKDALTALTFSLDGADEVVHDGIRGAGSFREVMQAIMLCSVHDVGFVLQMTLHAKNVHQVEAMGMLATQLGARRLSFCLMQPTGTHHDASMRLTAREWRVVQDRIDRLVGVVRVPISLPEGWYSPQTFHVCQSFASQQLHIDVDGKLNLCCMHSGIPGDRPDVGGDLREVSLPEAHRRLLTIIHDAQATKLAHLESGAVTEWDKFGCNFCLKSFGKPHWTDDGVGGPAANRERWRGAWAPRQLPIVK
jgi:MoaA/NifB/PqqE/SkfB family radical SAM enzyme